MGKFFLPHSSLFIPHRLFSICKRSCKRSCDFFCTWRIFSLILPWTSRCAVPQRRINTGYWAVRFTYERRLQRFISWPSKRRKFWIYRQEWSNCRCPWERLCDSDLFRVYGMSWNDYIFMLRGVSAIARSTAMVFLRPWKRNELGRLPLFVHTY